MNKEKKIKVLQNLLEQQNKDIEELNQKNRELKNRIYKNENIKDAGYEKVKEIQSELGKALALVNILIPGLKNNQKACIYEIKELRDIMKRYKKDSRRFRPWNIWK